MEQEVILEVKGLKMYYPIYSGVFKKVTGHVKAVDDVNLYVKRGETLGLVGESGCGKSSLGKCLVRLQRPTGGEMRYRLPDGQTRDLLTLSKQESFDVRKHVQIVFQDPYSSLNPVKTIYEAFDEPLRKHKMGNKAERKAIIGQLLESVNLRPDYMYRYPHEFSGGQRQRICIARALCINPELIVCDEPVSALDVSIQAQVLNLMKDLQQRFGLTYIFIAHDLSVVEYMSDRIAVMYLGQIVELAPAGSMYSEPRHPYTEALLSAIPIPDPDDSRERIVLRGDVPSPANPPQGCRFHTRCPKCIDICKTVPPELRLVAGTEDHYTACHLVETEEDVQ
ncbi:ATP-binding cassette domain-containing protein [Paenibacillus sp. IB182496]|uniref:ATP-binding cassette domain-containing protein n=1 Tax=Paenibacillus sabuli TaxID=2772509 RepID=A0A927BWR8_9BACL|nr:oligopeptide/dipeptide ABC transporter ATP-binding protein [Paenibacillus sabuli]MBD2848277.1 ATP-binding cassette domain-containing protein [Paenibacillus sabuli]